MPQILKYSDGAGRLFPLSLLSDNYGNHYMTATGVIYKWLHDGDYHKCATEINLHTTFTELVSCTKINSTVVGNHLLFLEAKRHPEWKKYTSGPSPTQCTKKETETIMKSHPKLPEGRTYSAIEGAVNTRGYVIASISENKDRNLVFSDKPVIHLSERTAIEEAERLAKENPGVQYAYLMVFGVVKFGKIIWE